MAQFSEVTVIDGFRTRTQEPDPLNKIELWSCGWDNKPGKKPARLGSMGSSKTRAIEIYQRKEAQGLNPVLTQYWISGFAF